MPVCWCGIVARSAKKAGPAGVAAIVLQKKNLTRTTDHRPLTTMCASVVGRQWSVVRFAVQIII